MRTTILFAAMVCFGFAASVTGAQPSDNAIPAPPQPSQGVDVNIRSETEPEAIAVPPASLDALHAPAAAGPAVRYQSFSDVRTGVPECPSCIDAPYPSWHTKFRLTRRWYHQWKPALQESHWGYCEYFDEPPYGAAVRSGCAAMIHNGAADQYTLYQGDFHPCDTTLANTLNERGRRELAEIAQKYRLHPVPILIERSRVATLDVERRTHVLEELRRAGAEVPDDFVFVDSGPGHLEGVEAVNVYQRFLSLSRPRGSAAPASRTPPTPAPAAGVPPQ
jgi:hypothetical protein